MITRLQLKDFQKHKELNLRFTNTVNCIVGPSDTGKSSIIRAIRWALLNKPNGSSFVRYGQQETKVRLKINNHTITRIKGQENLYFLDNQKYASFGTQIPEDIRKVINVEEHNFQCQFDSPFWFSETGGEISKQLNSIVNLEIIDKAQSFISSQIKEQKTIHTHLINQIENLQNTIDNLTVFEEIDGQLSNIEQKQEHLKNIAKTKQKIGSLLQKAGELVRLQERFDILQPKAQQIDRLVNQFTSINNSIKKLKGLCSSWQENAAYLNVKIPSISKLEQLYEQLQQTTKTYSRIVQLVTKLQEVTNEEKKCQSKLQLLEEQLHTMTGQVCPLCGQRIP